MNRNLLLGLFCIFVLLLISFGFYYKYNDVTEVKDLPVKIQTETKLELNSKIAIGTSTENRNIELYSYNKLNATNTKNLLIVGGIHGGYEWNSTLLAYELVDYLDLNTINNNVNINIIPSLNLDATKDVTGKIGEFVKSDVKEGDLSEYRFNSNDVDLNRNFDCNWQKESMWKNKKVSAGTKAFSEKESRVLRDYIIKSKPDAVIFLHSAAGAVYASECNDGVLDDTLAIMNAYAKSAGYDAVEKFDSYKVTGDAEGWLASIGVPAITVELTDHTNTEFGKNLSGIRSVVEYLAPH